MRTPKELKKFVPSFDGIFSTLFTNPLSQYVLYIVKYFRITPNQVTIFAFFLGVLSCMLLFTDNYILWIVSGCLFQLSFIFDGVDGCLARYKKISSYFGAWLDRILDRVIDSAIVICLSFVQFRRTDDKNLLILLSLVLMSNFLFWTAYDSMCIMGMYTNSDQTIKDNWFIRLEEYFKNRFSMRFVFGRDWYLLACSLGAFFYNAYITLILILVFKNINTFTKLYLFYKANKQEK